MTYTFKDLAVWLGLLTYSFCFLLLFFVFVFSSSLFLSLTARFNCSAFPGLCAYFVNLANQQNTHLEETESALSHLDTSYETAILDYDFLTNDVQVTHKLGSR